MALRDLLEPKNFDKITDIVSDVFRESERRLDNPNFIFRQGTPGAMGLQSARELGQGIEQRATPITDRFIDFGKRFVDRTLEIINPGQTFVEPVLEKRGISPGLAFGIGLGIDLAVPIPGPGKGKAIGRLKRLPEFIHLTPSNRISSIKKQGLLPSEGYQGKGVYGAATVERAGADIGGIKENVALRLKEAAKKKYGDFTGFFDDELIISGKIDPKDLEISTDGKKWKSLIEDIKGIDVSGIVAKKTKSIAEKKMSPFAKEARKFDTAEEFVEKQLKIGDDVKFRSPTMRTTIIKGEFVKKVDSNRFIIKTKLAGFADKEWTVPLKDLQLTEIFNRAKGVVFSPFEL